MKKNRVYGNDAPGYPVTFGRGTWDPTTLSDDNKIRFMFDADDTKSGAIYVGNQLASSKILDIQKRVKEGGQELVVKFIDTNNDVSTLTFGFETGIDARVDAIENFLKGDVVAAKRHSSVQVDETQDQTTGFNSYEISVNVDNVNIKDVDGMLKVSSYSINKWQTPETSDAAATYGLYVTTPDGTTTLAGNLINIPKDFFVKAAYVVTYNLDEHGDSYQGSGTIETPNVYGRLDDSHAEYADITVEKEGEMLYLERALIDRNLIIGNTYLHLVINIDGENSDEDDVFIDFTDIIESDAFAKKFEDISTRIAAVEGNVTDVTQDVSQLETVVTTQGEELDAIQTSYVKDVVVDSTDSSLYDAVTVTTSKDGVDEDSSFVIPTSEYFSRVENNFNTISNILTWTSL